METENQNLNQRRTLATRLGLSKNVFWMSVVSFLNDLSSDMIFPFIPIFLTSVLGASLTFVGLVEGIADATASLLKIPSGWISDRMKRRKPFAVLGYSLSAISKPMLALAALPWHVLGIRFLDRVGKGTRESPRDALISFSTPRSLLGRAFGFHRGMDTLGAAFGPLLAVLILPFINENYRILFFLSFIASFFAVLVLIFFVREVRIDGSEAKASEASRPLLQDVRTPSKSEPRQSERQGWRSLGAPFFLFLAVATIASLGRASEAFLILRARDIGLAITLIPIAYFAYSITAALLGTPIGIIADRVGKRNTFIAGLVVFAISYIGFSFTSSLEAFWLLLILYGVYASLTDGVGRAIVAGLVVPGVRGTAFGIYSASTGLALLPASLVFGYLSEQFGSRVAFMYGAGLSLAAVFLFLTLRKTFRVQS